MGRELRRKQAKREGKSLKSEEIKVEYNVKKIVITCVIVLVSIGLVYLISALFITKELDWFSKEEVKENTSGVENSILASAIFKQKEDEYYVYFYDFNEDNNMYKNIVSSKLSSKKVYNVDTSSGLNSNYVSDVSNKKATGLDDLKVVNDTVIKIVGDTIVEYYEKDEINNIGY
ncbi:unknown [Clostridium sp. CAG:914]|nr:unknown [Clostridium sp. CAG:914]